MKTRNFIQLLFFMMMGIWFIPIHAQENLNRLFEKCEQLEYVKMNIVEQRNPSTKKISQRITTVSFSGHPELENEFLAAFEKDKEDATQVISEKRDNKIVPTFFSFTVNGATVSFSFSSTQNNKFSVTRIENGN